MTPDRPTSPDPPPPQRPIRLATRGSPLALAQTYLAIDRCRAAFPDFAFEIRIIKTTGDRLQRASMAQTPALVSKGLFTKELETALLRNEADLAVHSLKDLPTELPSGLTLGAVLEREDARDVFVCRSAGSPLPTSTRAHASPLDALPPQATVGTSSTRRREQLLELRPDLRVVQIRGNLSTRLDKLAHDPNLAATLLAAAGLRRLGYQLRPDGAIHGPPQHPAPPGLRVALLPISLMIPCVGQAAIGIETRADDPLAQSLCLRLDHDVTRACVTAERAFLRAMGGGCLSPVAAYAEVDFGLLRIEGVSFRSGSAARAAATGPLNAPESLGQKLASRLS